MRFNFGRAIPLPGTASIQHARFALCAIAVLASSCTTTVKRPKAPQQSSADSVSAAPQPEQFAIAHGAMVYVNAMNCEMTAEDARRLNAFAKSTGISVSVVFVGLTQNDSMIVRQASTDLGLTVPARALRDEELVQYKSIGITRMPLALVIKGKQLATIVTGESMPKTVGLIMAAFSPDASK